MTPSILTLQEYLLFNRLSVNAPVVLASNLVFKDMQAIIKTEKLVGVGEGAFCSIISAPVNSVLL